MSKINPDIKLKGDLNPLIKEARDITNAGITRPVSRVGGTVEALWNITFGKIDHWNDKTVLAREKELRKLIEDTDSKIDNIPSQNLQEPKMSIVGPAVTASQFFYEEEQYREMFSNLISKSMDKKYNNIIHPSFSEIIKELLPRDAKFLDSLTKNVSVPISKFKVKSESVEGTRIIPESQIIFANPNMLLKVKTANIEEERAINSTIDNLVRLGLIEIVFGTYASSEEAYNPFKFTNMYSHLVNTFGEEKVSLDKGLLSLTSFGQDFISVCL